MMISMVYSKARLVSVVITLRHLDQETVVHFVWFCFFSYVSYSCVLSVFWAYFSPLFLSSKMSLLLLLLGKLLLPLKLQFLALGAFLTSSRYVNLDIHSFFVTSAFNMLFFVYGYIFIMIWELCIFCCC